MSVNPLYVKFQACVAFLMEQLERTGVSIVDIQDLAPAEHARMWAAIGSAEGAYKQDSYRGVDTALQRVRSEYFHGVNAVNKARRMSANRGI